MARRPMPRRRRTNRYQDVVQEQEQKAPEPAKKAPAKKTAKKASS